MKASAHRVISPRHRVDTHEGAARRGTTSRLSSLPYPRGDMDADELHPIPSLPEGEKLEATQAAAQGAQLKSASAPPPSPPWAVAIFVGPSGIRAGWRLGLFLLIASAFWFVLQSFVRRAKPLPESGPLSLLRADGLAFLAVLLSAWVMGKMEKRSLGDYALPVREAFGVRFWQGVIWGFAALTVLLLLLRVGHVFYFGSLALLGTELVFYGAWWAFAFLFVGFVEEFLWRGYALFTLSAGMGFWPAAFLLSAIFGLTHLRNPGEAAAGSVAAALIGLFFSFTVRRTGSLWFAVGMHAMWDYSESFIYSVPNSGATFQGHLLNSSFHGPKWLTGGTVGPEGSALVFVICAALFIVFGRLYPEARFPKTAVSGKQSF